MRLALREAERALEHDDVPIGCVIVHGGEVIAAAPQRARAARRPTAHAEILALREASGKLGGWRLLDTVLYVTLEPCAMCAGAIVLARVPRVVFGAAGPQGGRRGQRARRARRAAPEPPPETWPAACWPRRPLHLLRALLRFLGVILADKSCRCGRIRSRCCAESRIATGPCPEGMPVGRVHLRARARGPLPLHQPVRRGRARLPAPPVARRARAVGSHPARRTTTSA